MKIISVKNINKIKQFFKNQNFNKKGSQYYWESRYRGGGNSGAGSYNKLAEFKASVVNKFIQDENINKVIEWGCGDGNQLSLMNYKSYIGIDVSTTAIKLCVTKFSHDSSKKFYILSKTPKNIIDNKINKIDMSISLDIIFHLIEDDVFKAYMDNLFDSSNKFVCIYSSNMNSEQILHVKHRKFSDYIQTNFSNWSLYEQIKNKYLYRHNKPDFTSFCDFYFYKKNR